MRFSILVIKQTEIHPVASDGVRATGRLAYSHANTFNTFRAQFTCIARAPVPLHNLSDNTNAEGERLMLD